MKLYEKARVLTAYILQQEEDADDTGKVIDKDAVGPSDVERVISSGIPAGTGGSLQKASLSSLAERFGQKTKELMPAPEILFYS